MSKRIELQNYLGLVFLDEPHEYYLDGVQLSGVTPIIQKLFPTEYSGVPSRILEAAANYGKTTHKKLEDHDVRWKSDMDSVELQDYISICKENNLVHEASELLICNPELEVASAIDKVYRVSENVFSIADIKCLYGKITGEKLEKVRWQLSCYRTLFLQNFPGATIDKLMVIHLYHKQKKDGSWNHTKELIYVDPIPDQFVMELLACKGEGFKNPFAIPQDLTPRISRLKELIKTMNAAKDEIDAIKADILSSMEFLDVKSWISEDDVRLTRKLPTTRSSFDLKTFKSYHSDIPQEDYDKCYKTSQISGSLQVTV